MECWKLKKINCQNFRNLSHDIFEFVPGINCILGENGNGKTNLLEAIYYLTNKKSFRKNVSFPQLINIEGERPEFIIQSLLENEEKKISYSVRSNVDLEERFRNGIVDKSKCLVTSVFLNPFDSFHFHTIPSFRRGWLDSHLSILSSDYKKILSRYNKALKFRNSLLAQRLTNLKNQIIAIDIQISSYSKELTSKRENFCYELNEYLSDTYKKIFSADIDLKLSLESKFIGQSEERIANYFEKNLDLDIQAGITRYGIHRDDMLFEFNGLNAFEFCSLGQQKMAFLSLIFAYIELFRYKFSSYPLLLIDDVSGELDSQRWKNLIQYLEQKDFQVVITTANESFGIELGLIPNSRKFYINHGKLSFNHG